MPSPTVVHIRLQLLKMNSTPRGILCCTDHSRLTVSNGVALLAMPSLVSNACWAWTEVRSVALVTVANSDVMLHWSVALHHIWFAYRT